MKKSLGLIFIGLAACASARALDLFVATNGNDQWTGRLSAPNATRTDGPFATFQRGQQELRAMKAGGPLKAPVTIQVRAGIYTFPQTFKVEAADSGTAAAPVVFRAFGNEKPILIGGKIITGFAIHQGPILKTDVGAQGFKNVYFRQLIFDGKRQHLARYPNFDPQNPYGGGFAYADGKPIPMYQDVPNESRKTLQYRAQDERRWANPAEGEIFVFARYNWWNNIIRIASIDPASQTVTLANDASYPIRPGDRYYFRNLLEELDSPGEWYLDKATGTLYFWPPAPLASKALYAPVTRTILELGPGTVHVTFRGFIFECCEGTAITLRNTTNCLIAANTIRNVGDYNGSGVSVSGGFKNGVAGNDIFETGSHGVSLSGGETKTLTAAENYADNNYIHHVGVFYKQGVGISLNGVGNRASHNLIHDGPRMGIMFGGNNLVIEYNHIRHVNLETEDTGAVYTGGRNWIHSRGTVIRYNYFLDILGYGQENGQWVSPRFAWGVYLDDNAGGVDVIGNIISRCSRAGVHLHNGRDNYFANNIIVENRLQQIECNGWTANHRYWTSHLPTMIQGYESVKDQPAWRAMRNMHIHPTNAILPDGKIMSGNKFERNIIYYQNEKAGLFRFSTFNFDFNQSDSNLIWHAGLPLNTGQSKVGRDLSTNLLANPGFETGDPGKLPTGWSWQQRPGGAAKALASTETRFSGQRSLQMEGISFKDDKGKSQYPVIVSATITGKPGRAYRLTVRLKSSKPESKVSLFGQSYIANVYFWAKDSAITVGPAWKDYEFSFRLPAPGESGYHEKMDRVQARFDFKEESGTLWIDDVSLKEAESLDGWASWQALGFDRHSLIADPLFVAPEKNDYRLKPNSPAFKLGFQTITVEKIGPYADPLRASWPIIEADGVREKPMMPSAQLDKP